MGSTHAAHCDSDEISSGCSQPLTHRHLLAEALDAVRDGESDEADLRPAELLDLTGNQHLQMTHRPERRDRYHCPSPTFYFGRLRRIAQRCESQKELPDRLNRSASDCHVGFDSLNYLPDDLFSVDDRLEAGVQRLETCRPTDRILTTAELATVVAFRLIDPHHSSHGDYVVFPEVVSIHHRDFRACRRSGWKVSLVKIQQRRLRWKRIHLRHQRLRRRQNQVHSQLRCRRRVCVDSQILQVAVA